MEQREFQHPKFLDWPDFGKKSPREGCDVPGVFGDTLRSLDSALEVAGSRNLIEAFEVQELREQSFWPKGGAHVLRSGFNAGAKALDERVWGVEGADSRERATCAKCPSPTSGCRSPAGSLS